MTVRTIERADHLLLERGVLFDILNQFGVLAILLRMNNSVERRDLFLLLKQLAQVLFFAANAQRRFHILVRLKDALRRELHQL